MNKTEDARALCPYYQKMTDKEIQCEGCVHRARLVFVFHSKTEALRHKREYCDQYSWDRCPYAGMLSKSLWVSDFRRSE